METDSKLILRSAISGGITMCESMFNCKRSAAIDVVLFIFHSILAPIAAAEIHGTNSMSAVEFLNKLIELEFEIRFIERSNLE